MPRVVLVRHGEADWEVGGRLMGRIDVDLTEHGVDQAVALERRLADLAITAIRTSPLARARHTAELIGRALDLTPAIDEDLIDLDFGGWTGHTPDDLMRHHPAAFTTWLDHPADATIPDGETLGHLRPRVEGAIERILAGLPDEANVLIVTHEHPARSVLTHLLGLGPEHHWQIDVDAGSLSVFERRGDAFFLTLLNEICHLHEPPAIVRPGT